MFKMNTEDPMKFYYQRILGINPGECQRFGGSPDQFEIKADKNFTNLGPFLEGKVQVVAIDNFSTKEVHDQVVECIPLPARSFYRRLYVELNRFWGSITYEESVVGLADNLQVYNGYPNLINPELFAKNPNEE